MKAPDFRCAACGADQFPHVCPGPTKWRITLAMVLGGGK